MHLLKDFNKDCYTFTATCTSYLLIYTFTPMTCSLIFIIRNVNYKTNSRINFSRVSLMNEWMNVLLKTLILTSLFHTEQNKALKISRCKYVITKVFSWYCRSPLTLSLSLSPYIMFLCMWGFFREGRGMGGGLMQVHV